MCVSRHWQGNFYLFFGGGGVVRRAMKSSAVPFVFFLYLLNISYYTVTYFGSPYVPAKRENHVFKHICCLYILKTNKKSSVFFSVVEFSGQARGVLRETWYNLNDFDLNRIGTMREHSVFNSLPESEIILQDFDAPVDVAEKYVQRLTSYLQVNPRFTEKTSS